MKKRRNLPPVEQIPATVPADYIKNKDIDKDLEVFACLDGSIDIGGFRMRIPSLGVFSVVETFDCRFIGKPEEAKLEDLFRFLYINHFRKECVADVYDWIQQMGREYVRGDLPDDEKKWHAFDRKVIAWGNNLPFVRLSIKAGDQVASSEIMRNACEKIQKWISLCFTGFEMIPPSVGGGDSHVFGAVSIGGVIAGIGASMNVSYEHLLWETPYTLLGHVVAQTCRNNGAEGVARPKCKEDIKKQLQECKRLQHEGKLLPWQIDDPLNNQLSQFQKEYYPELEKELNRLRDEAKAKKGIK